MQQIQQAVMPTTGIIANQPANIGLKDSIFFKMASVEFIKKIINVSLYQGDFDSKDTLAIMEIDKQSDIAVLITDFLKHINKQIKKSNHNQKFQLQSLINVTLQIIHLKTDISSKIITYNNVVHEFTSIDPTTLGVLNHISQNPISNNAEFNDSIESICKSIQIFNELMTIDNVLVGIDSICSKSQLEDFPILSLASDYHNVICDAYNSLSSLTSVATQESAADFLTFKDELSVKVAIREISSFLTKSYNHYMTNYSIFDEHVSGLESSSVHIIAGPSNHAKSIFMINLARNIIKYNHDQFDAGDAIVFITLEDDIHKLLRRIISVFGGYDTVRVKDLFTTLSTYFQNHNQIDKINTGSTDPGINLLQKILTEALVKITGSKVSFIIKHCNENSFSMRDCIQFMDKLKTTGHKVKGLFIDYLDVMKSSASNYDSYKDDYNLHGEILQEMRTAARNFAIPIVTITQNARSSENVQQELSNSVIGDSYKKVRYADYIYMIRQRPDIDIISDQLKQDMKGDPTILSGFNTGISGLGRLVPFEVKITKAKDGDRGAKKIHIFSKQTLGIYDDYSILQQETMRSNTSSVSMLNELQNLDCTTEISNIESLDVDDDPIEGLIL